MDILFLSPADWSGPRGRFQHIAERLAVHNRVLYADGLGVREIGPRDWKRALTKVALSLAPYPRRAPAQTNLRTVTPLAIPWRRYARVLELNRRILTRFFREHLLRSSFSEPLLWVSYPHPDLVPILRSISTGAIIYDCVDDWREFARVFKDVAASESELIARADLVFATAPPLYERAARLNPRTILVPNGVDLEEYEPALSPSIPTPGDLAIIAPPRIGFIGNIAEWVDIDLLSALCEAKPAWNFVMIGRYQRRIRRPQCPNLHWLGYRPQQVITQYLAAFDVCIIPFVMSDLVRSIDPLKLYEYLAAGRPVVTTPLPSAADFEDLIHVATGTDGFLLGIDAAIAEGDERRVKRLEAVRRHSWDARFGTIIELVREHIGLNLAPASNSQSSG
jgi:glycosyltransferase involved in cell wall biosynthesis